MKHLGGDGSPLQLPLNSLGLSPGFIKSATAHGFKTLADFQGLSIAELRKMEWFTGEMFMELAGILKKLHKLISA